MLAPPRLLTDADIRRYVSPTEALAVMAAKECVNRSYETTLREGLLFEIPPKTAKGQPRFWGS
ncbi:MAG: hypothetical protein HC915_17435 [Anaerolineae bacterium]|nr:hypothetical protein [Anaerolineae bacterium]